MDRSEELPYLTFERLAAGVEFRPLDLTITHEMVASYCSMLDNASVPAGDYGNVVPPGFTGILGRRSYLQDYAMPGGGVLLGQTVELYAPVRVGERIQAQASAISLKRDGNRRTVVIETRITCGDVMTARVEVKAGWPA